MPNKKKMAELERSEHTLINLAFADFADELQYLRRDNTEYPLGRTYRLRIEIDMLEAMYPQFETLKMKASALVNERIDNAQIVDVYASDHHNAKYVSIVFTPAYSARFIDHFYLDDAMYTNANQIMANMELCQRELAPDEMDIFNLQIWFTSDVDPINLTLVVSKDRPVPQIDMLLIGLGIF